MGKTVNGFGVRNQQRTLIRKDLTGTYRGYKWFIMGEGSFRFRWSLGPLGGWVAGPKKTLYDTLRTMQRAYRVISSLRNLFGDEAVKTAAIELEMLLKWEQAAVEGRMAIKPKHSKDGAQQVYTVTIKK